MRLLPFKSHKNINHQSSFEQSEAKLAAAFNASPDLMAITKVSDGTIVDVNPGFTKMLGYTRSEAVGHTTQELNIWADPDDRTKFVDTLDKFGKVTDLEVKLKTKEGNIITVIDSARLFTLDNEAHILSLAHDISIRKENEQKLLRLNRALKMVNDTNQALIRSTDEMALLKKVCHIIIKEGGYRLAWVGYVEHDQNKTVRPVAYAGFDSDYIKSVKITWADSTRGQGPTGKAIRTGKFSIAKNILTDPTMTPWRTNAIKHGYQSSIAIPLFNQNLVFGVINIYANEIDAFSDLEINILEELANDLAFGIITLRTKIDLQISESKFKNFFQHSAETMLVINSQGDILEVNEVAIKRYGYSRDQFLHMNVNNLDAPDIPTNYVKNFKIIQKKGYLVFERVHLKKNGFKVPVEVSCSPIEYNGQSALLAIVRDISEHQLVEKELRQSEAKFATAFQTSPNAIIITRIKDGSFIDVNNAFSKYTRYSKQEALINSTIGLKLWADMRDRQQMFADLKAKKTIANREYVFKSKSGELLTGLFSCKPIMLNNEPCLLSVITDIREKKAAEEKLQKNEAFMKATLDATDDGILAINKSGDIFYANTRFGNMWHVPHSVLQNKDAQKIEQIVSEQLIDPNTVIKTLYANIPKKKSTLELLYCTDGRIFERFSTPLLLDDKLEGQVFSFRDVTVAKQIDQAKTEFVSLASHELRTPLSTINWYSEMLLSNDLGELNPKQKKYIEEAYQASQRMVDLVNALLNVSRIELGTFSIEPQLINLHEIACTCVDELQPMMEKKKIKFIGDCDEKLPLLMADPKLITIIFENLLSNAVKYSLLNGKVALSIKQNKDQVEIKVKDFGIGIPRNQQAKIYEKLFRADNVKKNGISGTGLGLYIVKKILDQCEGKIWFKSVENKGTTFFVNLPITGMIKKSGNKKLI